MVHAVQDSLLTQALTNARIAQSALNAQQPLLRLFPASQATMQIQLILRHVHSALRVLSVPRLKQLTLVTLDTTQLQALSTATLFHQV